VCTVCVSACVSGHLCVYSCACKSESVNACLCSCFAVFFFLPVSSVVIGSFNCAVICVWPRSHSPMVWPGVESGVTDPSGDGWNCCWTLVRIILVK